MTARRHARPPMTLCQSMTMVHDVGVAGIARRLQHGREKSLWVAGRTVGDNPWRCEWRWCGESSSAICADVSCGTGCEEGGFPISCPWPPQTDDIRWLAAASGDEEGRLTPRSVRTADSPDAALPLPKSKVSAITFAEVVTRDEDRWARRSPPQEITATGWDEQCRQRGGSRRAAITLTSLLMTGPEHPWVTNNFTLINKPWP